MLLRQEASMESSLQDFLHTPRGKLITYSIAKYVCMYIRGIVLSLVPLRRRVLLVQQLGVS